MTNSLVLVITSSENTMLFFLMLRDSPIHVKNVLSCDVRVTRFYRITQFV